MPRKRDTSIGEDLEQLHSLEREYRGKPEAARIAMVRLVGQQPPLSINEIAASVGYSVPTVKRWLKIYRDGGLEALLQITATGKQSKSDQGLDLLKQKLLKGDFHSFSEVGRWMGQYNSSLGDRDYARQVIAGKRRSKKEGRGGGSEIPAEVPAAGRILPEHVLRFLTSLPTFHTVQEWADAFRSALQELLGDVDRITLMVNIQCSLSDPEAYDPSIVIVDALNEGDRVLVPAFDDISTDETEPLGRLLAGLRRQKFPFETYHVPEGFVYYFEGAYLGVMVLWRERTKPPISECTLSVVESLRPFLVLLFSDLAARHQAAQPFDTLFQKAFNRFGKNGLTMQEGRVLTLQLLGCTYEEIADSLHISVNTVRSHIKAIYEKLGAHGPSHILAKYFKPMTLPGTGPK